MIIEKMKIINFKKFYGEKDILLRFHISSSLLLSVRPADTPELLCPYSMSSLLYYNQRHCTKDNTLWRVLTFPWKNIQNYFRGMIIAATI